MVDTGATTINGLGTVACAAGYHGTATVQCPGDGAAFVFSGCVENICVAADTHGYHFTNISASRVSELGTLNCSFGFEGQAAVVCSANGSNFFFSGCFTPIIECPMFTVSNAVLSPDPGVLTNRIYRDYTGNYNRHLSVSIACNDGYTLT
eukprot:COSAG05_NODE_7485_length_805_cov_0.922096_1_plen_149_part_10